MRSSLRRLLATASGLALGAGLLGGVLAPPASAEDLPDFSFADCPELPEGADPNFWLCNVAVTYGGTFKLGNLDQKITEPITLTYANGFDPVTLEEKVVFGGFKADRMLVQPGLFGDPIFTAVYARPRYAGSVGLKDGNLQLALKLSVINPLLGSNCSIGTDADPIKLDLTVGTTNPPPPNKPISGSPPEVVQNDPPVLKTTVVDNAFRVPGASRCGAGGSLNWAVNLYAGLPSAAGRNTAVFNQYVSFKTYTELQR
ncbi:hypothetical protein Arub01_01690 [Actinomadura rubrobrunea]|uniref:Secreted protein n=1 Tax=Actinomadura rubrobrunea TaxID=115335 RepID=A0A9W6UUQ7_9ACTN|nr:hypothetical protein [Actinomadura rubrobrunea]GLW61925.1 hypothetical protein Arub01_01690 [Actinomadura rubrobrunea]